MMVTACLSHLNGNIHIRQNRSRAGPELETCSSREFRRMIVRLSLCEHRWRICSLPTRSYEMVVNSHTPAQVAPDTLLLVVTAKDVPSAGQNSVSL